MKIFALSDLHLAPNEEKSMDIFGERWKGHFEKIKKDWNEKVSGEDAVLVPGDFSWAMTISEAQQNIDDFCALPGKKIIIKGNHDYWWGSLTKVKTAFYGEVYPLQNDSVVIGDYVFCGSRGWILPTDKNFSQNDRKIYEREKIRLKLSLDNAKRADKPIIVMMHYPPVYPTQKDTEFAQIISEYDVKQVVFGHIHGLNEGNADFTDIDVNGINYNLVSCDYLDFKLKRIL